MKITVVKKSSTKKVMHVCPWMVETPPEPSK
jgi:hypothetical protein